MINTVLFVAFVANNILWIKSSPIAASCGEFKVSNACVNIGCYYETCSDILRYKPVCKDSSSGCEPGCLCKDGYLRNEEGNCIPRDQCPEILKCPRKNEVYKSCVNRCDEVSKTCKHSYPEFRVYVYDGCSPIPIDETGASNDKNCTGKCVCAPGFYKNELGDCVSAENCPYAPKCNELEIPTSCVRSEIDIVMRCSDLDRTQPFLYSCGPCGSGCICKDGYLRSYDDGNCIPKNQCPEKLKCPRQNEVYASCRKPCEEDNTCDMLINKETRRKKNDSCPFPNINKKCIGQCICEPNFYRNKLGDCVSKRDCYLNNTDNE